MKFVIRISITALALLLVARFIPGIEVTGIVPALIAALLLGILNAVVRPILVVLTLPITIVTLGLFIFVINAFMFWFIALFVDGFSVSSFFTALIGSLIVSAVSAIAHKFV